MADERIDIAAQFPTLDSEMEQLREFVSNPQKRARTGFPTLDSYIEGPAAGEIITFLGRSYTGKSMLIHNMMLNKTEAPGYLVFSMEMPTRGLLMRMASAYLGISHGSILEQAKHGKLTEKAFELGTKFGHHVIIEDPMSIAEMSDYLFVYNTWFEQPPAAVIIDYLELIQTDMRMSGWERTEQLARQLKVWAKEQHIPVYLVHQSNMKRKSWEKPDEESARGGGYREADVVVGIHKPSRNTELSPMERQELEPLIKLDVIKNRINGRENWSSIDLELKPSLRLVDIKAQIETEVFPL